MKFSEDQIKKAKKLIKKRFKGREGKPFPATTGQANIFLSVLDPKLKRVTIKATTQYGKSDVVSMGLIQTACSSSKKILIVAPGTKQAKIIMDYIIAHIFDHPYFQQQIEFEGSVDRFKRERSKSRIDFKTGATIMVLTADARTVSKEAKSLMGFGGDIIVVDESSLIPDKMFNKILRMVGGVKNGKIIQLGNPFEKNHFHSSFHAERYYKISIDYHQAMAEGRLDRDFVLEAQAEMDPFDFKVFYECEFPDNITDGLIPLSKVEAAINRNLPEGPVHFGGDVARFGNDQTVAIIRKGAKVTMIDERHGLDTMATVGFFRQIIDGQKAINRNIDEIGVGAGVVDRLNEEGYNVNGVNVASKPQDPEKFANLRAEIFWGLRQRFNSDDISIPDSLKLIKQLSEIRFSYNSRGQILIEGKEQMKKRGLQSPDIADALALAFYSPPVEEEINIDVY